MRQKFWHNRWSRNEIGFHSKDTNPFLIRHWPTLQASRHDCVFVPLSGKSIDLLWLAEQCANVVAIELSEKAIEDFFSENKLTPNISQTENFKIYQAGNIRIFCGDFFELEKADIADCQLIYDRASLIAFPADMRQQYVKKLDALFEHPHKRLLITLEYDQHLMDGPPFSVSMQEVDKLFSNYKINRLESVEIIEKSKRFKDKGLESLLEHVFILESS
jgi:thiopurine S-methyltransferase